MAVEPGAAAPDLARLKRYFEEARDLTQEARAQALIDLDYYDGAQWTAAERAALRLRRQPDIVINRIKPAINGIIGVTERGRSEPRAFPRTPRDEDAAAVATDVLRFIADHNRLHRLKQDCFLDMLTAGSMAALAGVDEQGQVEIVQIRWEEFFADPRARRRDFKDARYMGVAKWMYADDLAAMYPQARAEVEAAVEGGPAGSALGADISFQDRPQDRASAWCDRRRRRLLVVEIYHRDGGAWRRCVFHGQGVLEDGPSPYQDAAGRPDCPIEAQSDMVEI